MTYLIIISILFTIAHILAYVKTPIGFKPDLDKGQEFTKLGFLYWFNSYCDTYFSILTINKYISIQFLAFYSNLSLYSRVKENSKYFNINFTFINFEVNGENVFITFCNIVLAFNYRNYDK